MMDFSRLSQKQLASATGFSDRIIRQWDCPRNADRSYDLKAVIRWMIQRAEDDSPTVPLDPESCKWLSLFRKERYLLAKIERLKLQGSLVHIDTIMAAWVGRVAATMHLLTNLVNRLPPLLEGKTRREMYDLIDDEIRAARTAYADDGPYCHLPEHCIYKGGTGCTSGSPSTPPDAEEA